MVRSGEVVEVGVGVGHALEVAFISSTGIRLNDETGHRFQTMRWNVRCRTDCTARRA